jgi:hypothetical protein
VTIDSASFVRGLRRRAGGWASSVTRSMLATVGSPVARSGDTLSADDLVRLYSPSLPYPPRPQLRPLPEFAGTALSRPDSAVQVRVERFVLQQYVAGRSLRELAELTDRSHSAVRNILDKHGVRRGAAVVPCRGPGRAVTCARCGHKSGIS